MTRLLHDLRIGFRSLRRTPGFTVVAVLTLALGIGATAAIFSVVHAVLLRPLPFASPGDLVTAGYLGTGDYRIARERSRSFEELALYHPSAGFNLALDGEAERVAGAQVSPNLFATLGVAPERGRGFRPEEERPGEDRVVALSHTLWTQRFGADPALVGREILVDSEPRTVVGVMPPGFGFPAGEARLWVPMPVDPGDPVALWGGAGGQSLGRLRAGVTASEAQAELRGLAGAMREANTLWRPPPEYGTERRVVGLQEEMVGDVRPRLLVGLGAVGLVLLIACANVANLQLARAAGRHHEVALRLALGAGRRRLVREVLTESTVLSAMAGVVGLVLAGGALRFLVTLLPADTPRLDEVAIDGAVLAFVTAVSMATVVLAGLVPALGAAHSDLRTALTLGGRTPSAGGPRRSLSRPLVVAEVALAVVLVIGAGLLLRSLQTLLAVEPGFRVESLLSARVTPPEVRYGDAERQRVFFEELLERIEGVPGIRGAALVDRPPLAPWAGGLAFEVEGEPYVPGTAAPMTQHRRVSLEYPRLMEIPLLAGRALEEGDRQGAPQVALINETMARRYWSGQDPVGKRFKPVWWQDRWITVVGVLADSQQYGLASEVEPEIYRPYGQAPEGSMTLVVRVTDEPSAVAARLRSAVAAIDREVPVSEVQTLREVVSRSVAAPRATTVLLSLLAAVALLLGAIGIYAVIAFGVAGRRHEIGVRMALGARAPDVVGLVVRQGLGLVLVGVGIGLALAFAGARMVEGLLFGVVARDPLTFAAVPLVLVVVGILAALVPAGRACRVDPLASLRGDG